ncbi:MAG: Formiminoglutamase [uncultured Sphingomonas sp.]|uniref:Formiminoglutamase n=1 Tax=uncultured Sphingomonas sp. TaxID=158754 RepID=A0A6J4SA68_9SPHN|nr:arginase family protein [uncultured Sphingomonas sp.]CAA9493528.1 MAG: Formiminoglutamase [uncultured Sphingomonas sp.]
MTSAWPNLQDLLVPATESAPIGLVGAPLAAGSVTPGRCDLAPGELREVLRRVGRYDIDTGNLLDALVADHGDLPLEGLSIEEATAPIREAVAASVAQHRLTLLIGGNNAVTRPGVHGLGLPLERVGLLTLDAHFDMRETDNGLGNGNPVRALMEDGLPGRNIAQVGLAPFANSRAMHQDALAAGNLVISASYVREHGVERQVERALLHLAHCDAIYVDCDIDVIDRSQFPGAPGARPGGMAVGDFFAAVRLLAAEPRVRAIDLTEWDPPLDPTDLSALTAGRWLAEAIAGFEGRALA